MNNGQVSGNLSPSPHKYNKSSFQQIQQMSNKVLKKEFYTIEKIIDRRSNSNGSYEYLIKWKNYPHRVNTWEPLSHLSTIISLVEKFNQQYENRMKASTARLCNSCLACSGKHSHNKGNTSNSNMSKKKRENLVQLKLDDFMSKKSMIEKYKQNTNKNIFTYRFDSNSENRSSKQSPSCKNENSSVFKNQQSKNSQKNVSNQAQYGNNLHPCNLFINMENNGKKNTWQKSEKRENIFQIFQVDRNKDQQGSTNEKQKYKENQKQSICVMEEQISEYESDMFQSDQIHDINYPPLLQYNQFHRNSSEIILPPPEIQNFSIKIQEQSPDKYYDTIQNFQTKQNKANELANRIDRSSEESVQKLLNLFQDGSQTAEKHKNRIEENEKNIRNNEQPHRERSRKKRVARQLNLLVQQNFKDNSGRRLRKNSKKTNNMSSIIKPRIKIDEIPPPTSIASQLKQFNHKRLCELQYQPKPSHQASRIKFKLENEDRRIVRVNASQIRRNFPKWLKQYYQSYI